jgi:hypothetical protein
MTGTVSGTDFGTLASQTQLNVVAPPHPMAAGQHRLGVGSLRGVEVVGVIKWRR